MQVKLFNLYSKSLGGVRESYDQFVISNSSIEIINDKHLVLKFWRKYDAVFAPGKVQVCCSSSEAAPA